jgi:hypothetical protein
MTKILHNLALFWVKNANFFAKFFGEKIQKVTTSVPVHISYFYYIHTFTKLHSQQTVMTWKFWETYEINILIINKYGQIV